MQDYDDRWRALKPGVSQAGQVDITPGISLTGRTLSRCSIKEAYCPCRRRKSWNSAAATAPPCRDGHCLVTSWSAWTCPGRPWTWARVALADAGLFGLFISENVRRMTCLANASFDLVVDGACLHCLLGPDRARAWPRRCASFDQPAPAS